MIVFVVGGTCAAEVRAAHELNARSTYQVLVGGTCSLTPATMLQSFAMLPAA
jgi:hypothetical protein